MASLVFANAGKPDAFDHFDVDAPTLTAERAPDMEVLDINLLGGCYTAILALSAFRRNPSSVQKPLLVLTSSGAGLYPVPVQPLYGAAKHGIVGLARSMGLRHKDEGFRVCALVPGLVPTTIMPKTIVDRVDQSLITPTTHIAAAIQDMLDNTDLNATVCEASVDRIFYRDPPDFPDVAQRRVLTEVSPNMAEDFKKLRDGTL
jgi:15-hydroxyprostaglandin dehydrogenase (NAD)